MTLIFKKSTAQPQFGGTPTISGTVRRGEVLTCSYSVTKHKTLTVEWYSYFDELLYEETLIATGDTCPLPGPAVGRYVRAKVTATNPAGTDYRYTALTVQVADAVGDAPSFEGGTAITGQPKVGFALTASYSVVGATTVTFQWQSSADGVTFSNIIGATSQTYTLTAGEQGDYVRVVVTAENVSGSVDSTSAPTGQIAAADAELPPPAGAPVGAIPLNASNIAARQLSDGAVVLGNTGAYYYLVGDLTFTGAAFVIYRKNITLDFNGCTVTYNTDGNGSEYGASDVPPPPWDLNTYTDSQLRSIFTVAERRNASSCRVNNNGILFYNTPARPAFGIQGDVAYLNDANIPLTTTENQDVSGCIIKNGTLVSNAGGHLSHGIVANSPEGAFTVTLSNLRVQSGTGVHSRPFVGQYSYPRFYDCVFINQSYGYWHLNDRHALPASVQFDKGWGIIERCAVVGGVSGILCGPGSAIRKNFISHYCYVTNGFGLNAYGNENSWLSGVVYEDNIILPYNGRGMYFDLYSRNNTARNNVCLSWEYQNEEYGSGLTASGVKNRYDAWNNRWYGNHMLAVAGRRSGDVWRPAWQGAYPITAVAPARRTSAHAFWQEAYGTANTPNLAYDNTLRSVWYGDLTIEPTKSFATAIGMTARQYPAATYPGSHDDIYDNDCYSNMGMVCYSQMDGNGSFTSTNSGNSFTWETGSDAYAAFAAAVSAKIDGTAFTNAVRAVVDEQSAVVLGALEDNIVQADAGLVANRKFWVGEYYEDGFKMSITLTDPTFGSGVDPATYYQLTTQLSSATSLRIARTHTLQLLDGGSPVVSQTVTVTPDQINGPQDDVTTTTTDASGNCTITYYEHALTRAGGSPASLTSQVGTSSTVSVAGVGSATITHASLPATLELV